MIGSLCHALCPCLLRVNPVALHQFNRTTRLIIKMSGRQQKTLVQPINAIFRYLQSGQKVSLYMVLLGSCGAFDRQRTIACSSITSLRSEQGNKELEG